MTDLSVNLNAVAHLRNRRDLPRGEAADRPEMHVGQLGNGQRLGHWRSVGVGPGRRQGASSIAFPGACQFTRSASIAADLPL